MAEILADDVESEVRKRFRFTEAADVRLLKATLLHNSHVAPRGSSLVAFKSVAEIFNDRAGTTEGSDGEDNISTNVSPKTLYESFRKLFKYFRVDDKKYRSMSGI